MFIRTLLRFAFIVMLGGANIGADRPVAICVLDFPTKQCGAASTVMSVQDSDILNSVIWLNDNIDACCHHPTPGYCGAYKMRQSTIHHMPIQCKEYLDPPTNKNVKWDMTDPSDTVSCSRNTLERLWAMCRQFHGVGPNDYVYVFNMPQGTCHADALGGEGFPSVIYMSNLNANNLRNAVLHESGHTFGLRHPKSIDTSDPMSYADETTCYNSIHSNYLGFCTSMGAPITPSAQPKYIWLQFAMQSFASSSFANHLIIVSNDKTSLASLSFRNAVTRKNKVFDGTDTKSPMSNLLGRPVAQLQLPGSLRSYFDFHRLSDGPAHLHGPALQGRTKHDVCGCDRDELCVEQQPLSRTLFQRCTIGWPVCGGVRHD